MRPSKLRLPLSTEATTRFFASISACTSSGSGPLFPMQVVQPYPTRLNPSRSRYESSPALRRYSVTTFEPGARLVFTHGCRVRPFSTAFFASSPAAIITPGFEVFVQLVIAAITTEPLSNCPTSSSTATADEDEAPAATFFDAACSVG